MFSAPATQKTAEPLAIARAVVFSPIGGEGLVEQAVRRLGEAIGLGLLEVGERLPPEADLAERFDIAPMTLRQALAILREAGYVETRRGRGGGTFVRRALPRTPARAAGERLRSLTVEGLRDLIDFRRARGKKNNWNRCCVGIALESSTHFKTVRFRHHHVKNHQIGNAQGLL